jgi:hypothetical protein
VRLLALDPGASTGWAFFIEGRLEACGFAKGPSKLFVPDSDHVVIENPQIYPHSEVDPNTILVLARMVGRYEERFAHIPTKLVLPREWKGTIKKPVMLKRIREGLTPAEKAMTLKCPDDTIDAIGLGKWTLRWGGNW